MFYGCEDHWFKVDNILIYLYGLSRLMLKPIFRECLVKLKYLLFNDLS